MTTRWATKAPPVSWLAFVATTLAGLWLLEALPWPARAVAVFLLVPLPVMAIAQMRWLARAGIEQLPRIPVYFSSGVTLWILAAATLAAALASGFTPGLLGLRPVDPRLGATWVIFALATALMLHALTRFLNLKLSPALLQILPRTWLERALFIALSITAGICEELVFRGFLISALAVPFGSALVAALISSILFGLLHAYQQPLGVVQAAVLGLALAIPFLATGSLIPSIIAHTTIDLIGGLFLLRPTPPDRINE